MQRPAQSSRWEAANTNPARGALGLCREPRRALSIPHGLQKLKLGLNVGLFVPVLQHRLAAPLGLSGLCFSEGEDEVCCRLEALSSSWHCCSLLTCCPTPSSPKCLQVLVDSVRASPWGLLQVCARCGSSPRRAVTAAPWVEAAGARYWAAGAFPKQEARADHQVSVFLHVP